MLLEVITCNTFKTVPGTQKVLTKYLVKYINIFGRGPKMITPATASPWGVVLCSKPSFLLWKPSGQTISPTKESAQEIQSLESCRPQESSHGLSLMACDLTWWHFTCQAESRGSIPPPPIRAPAHLGCPDLLPVELQQVRKREAFSYTSQI